MNLPVITEEDKQFLHYNPNTDDLVEWIIEYTKRAIEMNALIIPQSFELAGRRINIIHDPSLDQNHGCIGEARYVKNEIALQSSTSGFNIPIATLEHCYLHEVVHHILERMGEHELRKNEKFVDLFSGFLHQVIKTSKL